MQTITVAGSKALEELNRLRDEYKQSGLYPILFGDAEDFGRALETRPSTEEALAMIKESLQIKPAKWLADKTDEQADFLQEDDGEWPELSAGDDEMGIITHLDILTRKPKKEVLIGLLEIDAPWKAFAHVGWGGWNDCPFPAEHCALHRYWQEQWGAEVVSMTMDVVQCVVARPPQDRDAALALAREQYVYCYDIVEQGTQSIAALAAGLVGSHHWYFWWD